MSYLVYFGVNIFNKRRKSAEGNILGYKKNYAVIWSARHYNLSHKLFFRNDQPGIYTFQPHPLVTAVYESYKILRHSAKDSDNPHFHIFVIRFSFFIFIFMFAPRTSFVCYVCLQGCGEVGIAG